MAGLENARTEDAWEDVWLDGLTLRPAQYYRIEGLLTEHLVHHGVVELLGVRKLDEGLYEVHYGWEDVSLDYKSTFGENSIKLKARIHTESDAIEDWEFID